MDYKVLLNIDNEKIIKYNDCNSISKNIVIRDIFLDIENNKYDINDFFFIKDGLIIDPNDKIYFEDTSCNIPNTMPNTMPNTIINIDCHRRIKGGGFIDTLLDIVLFPFNIIIKPIVAIANVFMFLLELVFYLIKFIIWFVRFIIWIFIDLLNPVNFFNDFFKSILVIVYSIFNTILNILMMCISMSINTVGGWVQGFWGWDMSGLTKNDKNSPYFKSFDRTKGKKSYLTNTNTVPFSVILGTILCPPLGVFMDMGLTGWINIIVCLLLTLLFYLPGLCYALLIIYS